jgi:ribose transport system ATP-binding protein
MAVAIAPTDVDLAPLLRARSIAKSFDGVPVLHGIDFDIRPGEVHGLIGQNGAGKSTFVKVLNGAYVPDAGELEIAGSPVALDSSAADRGIAMVFQEFSLIPTMTVGQNIVLGHEPRDRLGLIDDGAADLVAAAALAQVGASVPTGDRVGDLPVGSKQLVEIAKAISHDARILILDEPTASLTIDEIQGLTDAIGRLTAAGIAIVFISHHLDEVLRICDRVTVIRDGRVTLSALTADVTTSSLIESMLGRSLEHVLSWEPRFVDRTGTPLLRVIGLSNDRLHDVSLDLHPGEILGIAGLLGSGRSELVKALYGIDPVSAGSIEIDGRPVRIASPRDAIAHGIALVPEDRARAGLVTDHSVRSNVLMAAWDRYASGGYVRDGLASEDARRLVSRLGIRTAGLDQVVRRLSGGNQQKVVVARNLSVEPRILLLDDPTVGIDVASKREILADIRELARGGTAVLLISSELEELSGLADRVLVLRRGEVARVLDRDRGDDLSVDSLTNAVQQP